MPLLSSSLIPARWRRNYDLAENKKPGFYNQIITPYLTSISSKACIHPIRTFVIVVALASLFYVNLLEAGFFHLATTTSTANRLDLTSLASGSRRVHLGKETGWKWTLEENGSSSGHKEDELALITLDFQEAGTDGISIPQADELLSVAGKSAEILPASSNLLSGASPDSSLALVMPYGHTASFLNAAREIRITETPSQDNSSDDDDFGQKHWLMKPASRVANSNSLIEWVQNSWSAFLDLIGNAETLDIIIMTLGYLSMYLTFISLFMSMRRMGSNFWLATSVLFSSAFAFLFGIVVTLKLGVPENVVLLSEGVPFLVVTVGFEKPIMLTQAVLSASIKAKTANNNNGEAPLTIQSAVQTAVKERGFEIVRDYMIEILILSAGAASGIQGGLKQFCFLAAWTLFFDCILLFTFYTAILTIKLEINRIRRYVTLRKALEEDGVSRRVAENVASSNDWPNGDSLSSSDENSIFGRKARDSSVPRFKVLMVSGFVLINVLNLCTIPFRGHRNNAPVTTAGLSSVVSQPPMDPFKVAGNGLDYLFAQTQKSGSPLSVTVFSPIKYELSSPSGRYGSEAADWSIFDGDYQRGLFSAVGGKVVESLLKSFEDPTLSKWVITALVMSLVLNGYLFNAARWSVKDTTQQYEDKPSSVPASSTRAKAASATNGHTVASEVTAPAVTSNEKQGPEGTPGQRGDEEIAAILAAKQVHRLHDEEIVSLSLKGKIPGYSLEKVLGDKTRAVKIRRSLISRTPATTDITSKLEKSLLPYEGYDYDRVYGACCENVVGYLPLPLGLAGPITIDGRSYFLPMATTEGVLVASASRGAKAINAGGGVVTVLTGDGMTRGPCVGFPTLARAAAAKVWLDGPDGQKVMREAFNSTSRFARLQTIKTAIAGTYVYIRFKTTTGDAMGMNMISKGVEHALRVMSQEAGFEDMAIITVSGNYCTDKKPAAINWVDGRGKSVVAEAIIPGDVVRNVLKSDVNALVELNTSKNLIGSAMAGSIGGFNAHASNIVSAIFLATGQDPAQNVESSNCITVMKNYNGALQISVSMPSIEVGTIGGGTILEPQAAMLDLLGVRGPHPTSPGENARRLARIVAAGVLAGELSLCSALAAGHLVQAHMAHNRSTAPSAAPSRGVSPARRPSGPNGTLSPVGIAMTSIAEKARDESRRR